MHVATCVITLQLYGVGSLKEKRKIIKSILNRLPKQFNVAVAEVDCQDVWRTAVIGLAMVGNDSGYLHSKMEKAVLWIEQNRPETVIEHYTIEYL
jgi:uncharacterized protein YlxP (DUF503 family)